MNKKDIIEAAFRVWGRDFYRRPSLSSLAKELKVSKPALYKHFESKEALTNAMLEHFFDDLTSAIQPGFEKALQMKDPDKGIFTILQAISGFYAGNCYALIFSLVNIYDRKLDHQTASEYMKARGTDIYIVRQIIEKKYKIPRGTVQLIFATLTFYMAHFHKTNKDIEKVPSEDQIKKVHDNIYNKTKNGLVFSKDKIDTIDFDKLEKNINGKMTNEKPEPLFKAVAEAVAEAGPWEASMEMVAKKMGISKSSLYGHFKNKKDMLRRLFITEFKRIIDYARLGISLSSDVAEQLYLGIYSIAVYLKSKPEILIAIDWIRTRKLDLGKPHTKGTDKDQEFFRLFEDIDIESLRGCNDEEKQMASGWILFLLTGLLMRSEHDMKEIRVFYRFISLGLGGFISNEK